MNDAPQTWNLDCPWCEFYIVAAQRSGAGEEAASMMTEHLMKRHPGKNWSDLFTDEDDEAYDFDTRYPISGESGGEHG